MPSVRLYRFRLTRGRCRGPQPRLPERGLPAARDEERGARAARGRVAQDLVHGLVREERRVRAAPAGRERAVRARRTATRRCRSRRSSGTAPWRPRCRSGRTARRRWWRSRRSPLGSSGRAAWSAADIGGDRGHGGSSRYSRTWSTAIDAGKVVSGATGPPRFPPTATLSSRKNGWSNTHAFGATSAGVDLVVRHSVEEPGRCAPAATRWRTCGTRPPPALPGRRSADAAAARVARAVERAQDLVGSPPHELHDVDLAGGRPADLVDVRPQHPEGRPQAEAARHPDARLEPAVLDLEPALGQQPRRGVLAGAVVAGQADPSASRTVNTRLPSPSRRGVGRRRRCTTARSLLPQPGSPMALPSPRS